MSSNDIKQSSTRQSVDCSQPTQKVVAEFMRLDNLNISKHSKQSHTICKPSWIFSNANLDSELSQSIICGIKVMSLFCNMSNKSDELWQSGKTGNFNSQDTIGHEKQRHEGMQKTQISPLDVSSFQRETSTSLLTQDLLAAGVKGTEPCRWKPYECSYESHKSYMI